MEEKYLYGAAVQGIQGFIFQTNELKDIVGASELVEQICTDVFDEFAFENGDAKFNNRSEKKEGKYLGLPVVQAAGNIQFIFDTEDACKKAVKGFPKKVLTMAPGITISQAVVKIEEGDSFTDAIDELQRRLKCQRNKPMDSITTGFIGTLRSRKTGLPVVAKEKEDYLDAAAIAKRKNSRQGNDNSVKKLCEKNFGYSIEHEHIAYNIEDITSSNNWIAIIHADGNGLGQVVQREKSKNDPEGFKRFSENLDKATRESAQAAFRNSWDTDKNNGIVPFRPVVLGGDDHTIICRADLAVEYAKAFIDNFEVKTEEYLNKRLTACAGIAFVKASYPFYYAYALAEELCSAAKRDAKKGIEDQAIAPSCIMFYKVQDSFVESYEEMISRELKPSQDISFEFGPYYINERKGKWTVDQLLEAAKRLNGKEGNVTKSGLRQWMSLLHESTKHAGERLDRIKSLSNEEQCRLIADITTGVTENGVTSYPVYDVLSLNTMHNQKTNK